MKDKYWAKRAYQKTNPVEYEEKRFSGPAGEIIDRIEKSSVLELLLKYYPVAQRGEKALEILDVACGTGRLSLFLKEKLNEKINITGLDISPKMLTLARRKAKKAKTGISFIEGDIYHLPFAENQFDAVVGLRFSMHLPEIETVLKELSRVVKKGGLIIFDFFNFRSLLRLRKFGFLPKERGIYRLGEIVEKGQRVNLRMEDKRGILLFGETILRRCPPKLLPLLSFTFYPSAPFSNLATKLVVRFRKQNNVSND